MPSIADIKSQYPDLNDLDDDQVVDVLHENFYQDLPRDAVAASLGVKPKPVPVAPTGFARGMGDRALALGQGVIGGAKMLSDLAGADNMVSENLGRSNAALQDLYSPGRKTEMKNRQALIQAADDSDSTLDQITTRLGGIAEAPLQTTLQAAGSMAPNIAAAVATGGVSAGPGLAALAARIGLPAMLGIGMGVGSVKGQNFEAVFQKAKQEGQTDDQATALAIKASEYSAQNAPQQALGGALGVLDSLTGAERFVGNMARKGAISNTKPAPGILKRALMGGAEEAFPEGLQGAQGQYAQNEALNNSGFKTNPYAGVLGAGINDAVVGAMLGAPLGAANGRSPAPGVLPAPPSGPLGRAAVAVAPGTTEGIAAQKAEPVDNTPDVDPADDPIMARIDQLPEASREEAAKAYAVLNNPKAAKGVQAYNKKLLDRLLSQEAQEFNVEKAAVDQQIQAQAATETIAPVTKRVDPETGEIVSAYDQRQADAPKQQDGDVLNLQGIPFTTIMGAKARQKELGNDYQVIRLAGTKYVVRAKQTESTPPDAIPAKPDAPAPVPATASAAPAPVAELSAKPDAVDVQNEPPATRTQTQAAPDQAPKAGKADEAGTTAAGAEAGTGGVEAAGVDGIEPWLAEFNRAKNANDEPALQTLYNKVKVMLNGPSQKFGDTAVKQFEQIKTDIETLADAKKRPAADAAPAIDIKAAAAKLIPDMSDAELTALTDHYGPDHKRTPKLQKEIEKRASNQAPAQEIQAQAATETIAESQPEAADVIDLAAEKTRRTESLVELRKRMSVLKSIRKCVGG